MSTKDNTTQSRRAIFQLGKIAFDNPKIERNAVEISLELRTHLPQQKFTMDNRTGERTYLDDYTPHYVELSICGEVWNHLHTDIQCGGQCLDTIAEYRKQFTRPNRELFDELYDLWKHYHLNGMHAGTPEQEQAIREWEAEGHHYDYTAICEMLKAKGLYEVNYTGLSVGGRMENQPYRYGHGWLVQELPGDVLLRAEHLIDACNANNN